MTPFWDKARHADRAPFLQARVAILRAVRAWFEAEGFVEVEPAALVASPGAEVHVDAFEADGRYLHTSPEFAMKKLLTAGEEKIFSLGKVWRRGEEGPLHASEFTMLEWYRAHQPYERVMDDCLAIVRAACDAIGTRTMQWMVEPCHVFEEERKLHLTWAFRGEADIPMLLAGDIAAFANSGVSIRDGDTFSDIFARVLTQKIEPFLGRDVPTILYEYPASEAALSRRCVLDPRLAERFELYICGIELANGYGELNDPVEQRARLEAAMAEKERRYGKRWPIDEDFLAALAHMPPASGVALGFDRLVMLASGARSIQDVLWTPQ